VTTITTVSLSFLAVIVAYLVLMIIWEWAIAKLSDYTHDDDWKTYTSTLSDGPELTYTTFEDLGWQFSGDSRQVQRAEERRRECTRIRNENKRWSRERVRDLAIRGIAWE
jgi:hypothetical protein